MAQHKSAKKRTRRNARRDVINHSRLNRIRSSMKVVETAIAAGDQAAAKAAFAKAMPELQRGVTKGVLHKSTVSRRLSRLTARIKKMAA
jgi:small subunit ribosomal protein S20